MEQIGFLVDGFNLYHSVLALKAKERICTKWLNVGALCRSYAHLFGSEASITDIRYFTALPTHLDEKYPGKLHRHATYMECLEDAGVRVVYGRFKQKEVKCTRCNTLFIKYEEKETDVSIAVHLIDMLGKEEISSAVLMTGDTDLKPAVMMGKNLFPEKEILFAFPYYRKTKDLSEIAEKSFMIGKKQYIRYQFPNPVQLQDGRKIEKPITW